MNLGLLCSYPTSIQGRTLRGYNVCHKDIGVLHVGQFCALSLSAFNHTQNSTVDFLVIFSRHSIKILKVGPTRPTFNPSLSLPQF